MALRRGAEAAKEASNNRSSGGTYIKTEYLSLKNDGDFEYIHYLTDISDLVTVKTHLSQPTNAQPSDFKGKKWPAMLDAACRNDPGWDPAFHSCPLCENPREDAFQHKIKKAQDRTWAVGVLQQKKIATAEDVEAGRAAAVGAVLGYVNKTRTIETKDKDDNVTSREIPAFVLVKQSEFNFWGSLLAQGNEYGSITDRVFKVMRTGKAPQIKYENISIKETPSFAPGTDKMLEIQAQMITEGYDLDKIIMASASDEFYARFFDASLGQGNSDSAQPTEDRTPRDRTPRPSNDDSVTSSGASEEDLAALRARLTPQPVSAGVPDWD